MAHVCLIGLGYIGLPTASVLSLHGHKVTGYDVRREVVENLKDGKVHIQEPDLTAVVREALRSGNLELSHEPVPADVFLICVQTPLDGAKADLRFVRLAAESVAPHLRRGNLVIVESTVPVGTTTGVVRPILETSGLRAPEGFHLATCPERVMPGQVLREIVENDRVIGGIDGPSAERARELYASFVRGQIVTTNCATAEFVKLAENAYRDVNVAFANELALIAERVGVDIWQAIEIANRHPRVDILRPGPGVGGHCIPVDPWFLVEAVEGAGLIRAARAVNDGMPRHVVEVVKESLADVEVPRVAAWGLAYKGNVSDLRESPAVKVVDSLKALGIRVTAHDPRVPRGDASTVSMEESVRGADCVLILTDHREFRAADPAVVGREMRRKVLVDTRASVDHRRWREAGFSVRLLGRPS